MYKHAVFTEKIKNKNCGRQNNSVKKQKKNVNIYKTTCKLVKLAHFYFWVSYSFKEKLLRIKAHHKLQAEVKHFIHKTPW